ncbi:unnamed protein product, partial [Ectocarpus sp. 13 AM-2016]
QRRHGGVATYFVIMCCLWSILSLWGFTPQYREMGYTRQTIYNDRAIACPSKDTRRGGGHVYSWCDAHRSRLPLGLIRSTPRRVDRWVFANEGLLTRSRRQVLVLVTMTRFA